MIPVLLEQCFPPDVRERGEAYIDPFVLTLEHVDAVAATAAVQGTRTYGVFLRPRPGRLHLGCTCPHGQEHGACKHLWALLRVLDALLLLWLVTTITFALIHLAPGDPATLLISPTASAEEAVRQRTALGLDAPLPVQYARWIGGVLRGELGESLVRAEPVTRVISEALPVSLFLGGVSLLASFVIGTLLGMLQALRDLGSVVGRERQLAGHIAHEAVVQRRQRADLEHIGKDGEDGLGQGGGLLKGQAGGDGQRVPRVDHGFITEAARQDRKSVV